MNKLQEFAGDGLNGKVISLSSYRGKKVLMAFFRDTTCPFCNMRLRELILNYPRLQEKNIDVIALFPSSIDEIKKYSGQQLPPFEILADPNEYIYREVGVKKNGLGMFKTILQIKKMIAVIKSGFMNSKSMTKAPILPLDILIDENGDVVHYYQGSDYGDHLSLEKILN